MKLHQKRLLDKLVGGLRSIDSTDAEVLEKIRTDVDYFERNAARCTIRPSLQKSVSK
jgi:hypothetical protein